MSSKDFLQLLLSIVEKCVTLRNFYVQEKDLIIDYICLFSHSSEEYDEFVKQASSLGTIIDKTKTGPVFKFNTPLPTAAGYPKVLKIRIPDATKPQLGDVDFNTDYPTFKEKYMSKKGFSLIQREKFEMMELKDETFNVLVYFSSIPPSKLIGMS